MFSDKPNPREPKHTLEELSGILESLLLALLAVGAVGVLAGAVAIIATMEDGSKSQGGRYFVAVGAVVALGWLDQQLMHLVWRRYALIDGDWSRYRRVCVLSGLLLLVIAVLLIGLARLLP